LALTIDRIERAMKDVVTPFNIRIEEAEKEINPFIDTKFAAGESLTSADRTWENAKVAMIKLSAEIAHLEYWENVYAKELKLKMFEECCAFLDASTVRHLKGLRNEQFTVQFSTVKRLADGSFKDEFAVTVRSETGGGEFESLSGGEQQMVSFAIGLALADLAACKTAAKPEFLIMDEPFSELDERNSEAIVDYLTGDFGKDRDTLLLISNEASLQGLIPERIHVIKQGGVSNVQV
jgi:DNA repair exonuclease SbcCD ATPase subunit